MSRAFNEPLSRCKPTIHADAGNVLEKLNKVLDELEFIKGQIKRLTNGSYTERVRTCPPKKIKVTHPGLKPNRPTPAPTLAPTPAPTLAPTPEVDMRSNRRAPVPIIQLEEEGVNPAFDIDIEAFLLSKNSDGGQSFSSLGISQDGLNKKRELYGAK